ncbi:MAG TPA: MFS transporter [Acidimicrobiales bacterium]|nr:MFS transporter [Acidimicrobiales bacterium]
MAEPPGTESPEPSGDSPAPRAWLTRNLVLLSVVSFLQDTASELLYPILPIFITAVLGAPATVLGTIEGLADGISAIVSPFAGRAADRLGRRPLIANGYGLAAVGKLLIALAMAWPTVLVARCVDRLGKGVRGAPRDALIADGVLAAQRGRAFGFHRAMDTSGAVAGPLIGLAAYELLDHRIRPLLWIAVIPALLSVGLVAFVRDPRHDRVRMLSGEAAKNHLTRPDAAAQAPLPPTFRRVAAILTVFSLVNFPDALLLLRLHAIGFSVAMTILAYATYNVVYALCSYPAGALSDHLSRARIYAVGLAFFSLGYIGLGLTRSTALAWIILCAYGMFAACTDGVGKAWVSSLVGPALQGRAQGIYQGLTGMAVVVAGVWAGLMWHGTGVVPLLVSGTVAGLFALWILVAPPDRPRARAMFTPLR